MEIKYVELAPKNLSFDDIKVGDSYSLCGGTFIKTKAHKLLNLNVTYNSICLKTGESVHTHGIQHVELVESTGFRPVKRENVKTNR